MLSNIEQFVNKINKRNIETGIKKIWEKQNYQQKERSTKEKFQTGNQKERNDIFDSISGKVGTIHENQMEINISFIQFLLNSSYIL
jgi:hypothetical protein